MPLIESLVCPTCRVGLTAETGQLLRCERCARGYPILDGIPSVLEDPPSARESRCALSVVIPAVRNADDPDRLARDVTRALETLEVRFEVLVGRGPAFGAALQAGFAQATGEYVLTLDEDGLHEPRVLAELWDARSKGEVVIASRYLRGGRAQMPAWRSLLSRMLSGGFRRVLSVPLHDLSSGYRLYSRRVLDAVAPFARDYDILTEMLVRAVIAGYRVFEVPFTYRSSARARDRTRLWRFAAAYLRTALAMWRLRNSIAAADYDARAYHSVIPLQRYWQHRRHDIISRMAQGFETRLDVGCGSSLILQSNPGLVGLDIQLHKLRYARRFGNPLVHGSIFALPFADQSFDCVICSEVIEHIPPEDEPFEELWRVLRPGGRLILGTPDYDRWRWRALEWLYGRLSPGGYADEHITHYGRKNLARYLQESGYEIEDVEYIFGSEMIFSVRKSVRTASPLRKPAPVLSGLRAR